MNRQRQVSYLVKISNVYYTKENITNVILLSLLLLLPIIERVNIID